MDKRQTRQGTPCSPIWDNDWIGIIDKTEARLRHRICGARTLSGQPCTLQSNHKNGRCRFHGGFNLTGAQPGNRNAVIHGLYSRALRPCNPQCPLWTKCPMAGDDVETLPAPERPTCPYEQTQFDTAVTDTFAIITTGPTRDPFLSQLARQTALIQVMLNRAATALREVQMTETTEATGDAYQMKSTKPSAYLQAFLRLSSEYRRYLQIIQTHLTPRSYDTDVIERTRRSHHDTSLTPEDQQAIERTDHPADRIARTILNDAQQAALDGLDQAAIDQYNRVARLSPSVAAPLYEEFKATSDELLQEFPTARPIIDRAIIGDEK